LVWALEYSKRDCNLSLEENITNILRGWETTYTIAQTAHHDEFTTQNSLVEKKESLHTSFESSSQEQNLPCKLV
jgi:hypothetical protein